MPKNANPRRPLRQALHYIIKAREELDKSVTMCDQYQNPVEEVDRIAGYLFNFASYSDRLLYVVQKEMAENIELGYVFDSKSQTKAKKKE